MRATADRQRYDEPMFCSYGLLLLWQQARLFMQSLFLSLWGL